MAKTIAQAEAELRAAALDYDAKHKAYSAACDVERARLGGWKEFADCDHDQHPEEWQKACRAVNTAQNALCAAATVLAATVAAESRAEAL